MQPQPTPRFLSALDGALAVRASAIQLLAVAYRGPCAWTVAAVLSSGESWDLTHSFHSQSDALAELGALLRSIERIQS